MKYKLLTLWLLGMALATRAQPTASYAQLTKLVNPPGAVFVQDSLWMDEAEVANIHWLEYLYFLRNDSSEVQYLRSLPDTAAWGQLSTNDPYIRYYLRYPGFRYYPVVGISYQQAVRYCRWRSAKVTENLHSVEYLKKHPKLRGYDFRVEFRLPTIREWELAAGGPTVADGQTYDRILPPVAGSKRYREEQVPKLAKLIEALPRCTPIQTAWQAHKPVFRVPFNVRESLYADDIRQAFTCPGLDSLDLYKLMGFSKAAMITEYCYAYPPNSSGCYNMIGNVAELTATPGIAKGGSFWHSVRDSTIPTSLPYTAPQMWLGFRCACTVYIEPRK